MPRAGRPRFVLLARAASRTYHPALGRLARPQGGRGAVHACRPCLLWACRGVTRYRRGDTDGRVVGGFACLPTAYGHPYTALHDALKAEGFVIYAGQGDLSKTLFRISTMGNLTSQDIDRLPECVCCARLHG